MDAAVGDRRARLVGGQGRRRRAAVAAQRPDPGGGAVAQAGLRARQPRPALRPRQRRLEHRERPRVVVGSGPNGLAAALTLAAEGVEVRVLEAADTLGGGTRSSELTLPGLLHDECSAAHPLAVDTPVLAAVRPRRTRPDLVLAGGPVLPSRSTAAAARPRTARWRRPPPPSATTGGRGGRSSVPSASASTTSQRTSCGRCCTCPEHPLKLARFGAYSALPGGSARPPLLHTGGPGAVRRRRRPRVPAVQRADVLGDRRRAGHRRAPLRLARRGGRNRRDHRRDGLAARGSRRQARDRCPGHVAGRAATRPTSSCSTSRRPPPSASRATACRGAWPARSTRFRHGPGAFKVEFAVEGGVPWTHEPSRRAGTVHVGGSLTEIATKERLVHQGGCPRSRSCSSASSTSPTRRARGATFTRSTATRTFRRDTPATRPRRSRRRSSASRPGFRDRILARARPVRVARWRRTTPTTSAATS